MRSGDRIICALDVDDETRALRLVELLHEHVGVFKVGLELINSVGVQVIPRLQAAGANRIFYDAKLHDIPNTVAGAMRGVVHLGVWCVTLHVTGGTAMLKAAAETAQREADATGAERPRLLGVTVLTSLGAETLRDEMRVSQGMEEYVAHLACLAYGAGCDGVIAAPQEIQTVRAAIPDPDFLVITPGVRPAGSDIGDQVRVMTPGEAVRRGASYLVIGRPITAASDPLAAAQRIAAEIAAVG